MDEKTSTKIIKARIKGISNTFDLELRCGHMTAESLTVKLLLQATKLSDFCVSHTGDDSTLIIRFMVARFFDGMCYAAEFCLISDRLIVGYFTSPAEWSSAERANACLNAFEPLFSLIHSQSGEHVTLLPYVYNGSQD
jgi:hypothetical protein